MSAQQLLGARNVSKAGVRKMAKRKSSENDVQEKSSNVEGESGEEDADVVEEEQNDRLDLAEKVVVSMFILSRLVLSIIHELNLHRGRRNQRLRVTSLLRQCRA